MSKELSWEILLKNVDELCKAYPLHNIDETQSVEFHNKLENLANEYAWECQYYYEDRVGDFFMQDPAEQEASAEVYDDNYHKAYKAACEIAFQDLKEMKGVM